MSAGADIRTGGCLCGAVRFAARLERMTSGPCSGDPEVPIGPFDGATGLTAATEIDFDQKPDSFAYAGEGRAVMTRQDCIDKFAGTATA